MPDPEKVIKGLKCCSAMSGDECRGCPYGHECLNTDLPYGMPHLAADALALLKEQPEVVRCKDCYFGEHTINGAGERCVQCTNSDLGMMGDCHTPNWFCADGERRDDNA